MRAKGRPIYRKCKIRKSKLWFVHEKSEKRRWISLRIKGRTINQLIKWFTPKKKNRRKEAINVLRNGITHSAQVCRRRSSSTVRTLVIHSCIGGGPRLCTLYSLVYSFNCILFSDLWPYLDSSLDRATVRYTSICNTFSCEMPPIVG